MAVVRGEHGQEDDQLEGRGPDQDAPAHHEEQGGLVAHALLVEDRPDRHHGDSRREVEDGGKGKLASPLLPILDRLLLVLFTELLEALQVLRQVLQAVQVVASHDEGRLEFVVLRLLGADEVARCVVIGPYGPHLMAF